MAPKGKAPDRAAPKPRAKGKGQEAKSAVQMRLDFEGITATIGEEEAAAGAAQQGAAAEATTTDAAAAVAAAAAAAAGTEAIVQPEESETESDLDLPLTEAYKLEKLKKDAERAVDKGKKPVEVDIGESSKVSL